MSNTPKERIPAEPKSGRETVSITAKRRRTTLTNEIPVKRAVLFQLVFMLPF
jgi:hypothetical protein